MWATVLSLLAPMVHAQSKSGLSSDMPDARTLTIQRKVDALFDKGDFDRAYFIYRNELAPLGDKYAQYMVGFMHGTGLGADEDVVAASAWYRLAAERGTPEFIAVRDRIMRVFTDEQIRRSDILFNELRLTYSDVAVLLTTIKRDLRSLESRTGSRVRGESSPIAVISGRSGNIRSGADYFGNIESQLEDRLERLSRLDGFEDIDTNPKSVNIVDLERKVKQYIQSQRF